MIAEGSFPFHQDDDEFEDAPRVGDGVIVLDPDLRVRFASPNAVSSMHRMGIHVVHVGLQLVEMGFDQDAVDGRVRGPRSRSPRRSSGARRRARPQAIPLLDGDELVGVVVLLRDVTDLRRRDRMLLSKDATIREIHHRVKNNLQTIAALLRLQGRRLQSPEAREAIEESERRIRSIAIVHETLSRDAGDVVPFDDIVRPLVRVVEETVVAARRRTCSFEVEGDAGDAPRRAGHAARGRAQRADAERGRPRVPAGRRRAVEATSRCGWPVHDGELRVDVVDDGVGLPAGFSLEQSIGPRAVDRAHAGDQRAGGLDRAATDDDGHPVHRHASRCRSRSSGDRAADSGASGAGAAASWASGA